MRRNCPARTNIMRASALVGTVGAALLATSPANAGLVNFTWNPAYPGGISTNTTGNAQFSADKITIADYAIINIPANPTLPGSITESGTLAATSFVNLTGVGPFPNAGFVNGTGSGSGLAGATPYQLYITFNATSHFTTNVPGAALGVFDSLTYTLWGDKGGNCDFAPTGVTGCSPASTALANGSLGTGANQVAIINGFPSASVDLSFNELVPAFFVNPPPSVVLTLSGAFTNTCGVVGGTQNGAVCVLPNPSQITINGGGGNLNFDAVPEPGTLWLLGAGLLGLAGVGRRMRARS